MSGIRPKRRRQPVLQPAGGPGPGRPVELENGRPESGGPGQQNQQSRGRGAAGKDRGSRSGRRIAQAAGDPRGGGGPPAGAHEKGGDHEKEHHGGQQGLGPVFRGQNPVEDGREHAGEQIVPRGKEGGGREGGPGGRRSGREEAGGEPEVEDADQEPQGLQDGDRLAGGETFQAPERVPAEHRVGKYRVHAVAEEDGREHDEGVDLRRGGESGQQGACVGAERDRETERCRRAERERRRRKGSQRGLICRGHRALQRLFSNL